MSIKVNVIIYDGQARSAGTKEATGVNGRVRCAAADAAYPGSCSNIIDPFSPIQFNSINLIIQISSCRGSRQPAPPIFFFIIFLSPLFFRSPLTAFVLCVPWTMTAFPWLVPGAADRLDETGRSEE